MTEKQIQTIAIDKIEQVENARITYAKEEMAELMTSMKHRGLLTPIGVRKKPGNGKWEVLFGNRRLTAARKLGWDSIDCMVMTEVDTNEEMLLINAVENMQRADVPYAEQGRIFYGLQKAGLSTREIAARIGIDHKRVGKMIDMYKELPERFRAKVTQGQPGLRIKEGKIPSSTASAVIALSSAFSMNKEAREQMFEAAGSDGMTSAKIRKVGGLLRAGKSVPQAIAMLDETRVVSVTLTIPIKRIKILEKEHEQSIHAIIYDHLVNERWLGIIHDGPKTVLRKKDK